MAETETVAFSPYLSAKFITILKKYYSEKMREERTKQQYTYVFNALCDYAKCDFLDITQETIKAYFNGKSRVRKPTTARPACRSTLYGRKCGYFGNSGWIP